MPEKKHMQVNSASVYDMQGKVPSYLSRTVEDATWKNTTMVHTAAAHITIIASCWTLVVILPVVTQRKDTAVTVLAMQ